MTPRHCHPSAAAPLKLTPNMNLTLTWLTWTSYGGTLLRISVIEGRSPSQTTVLQKTTTAKANVQKQNHKLLWASNKRQNTLPETNPTMWEPERSQRSPSFPGRGRRIMQTYSVVGVNIKTTAQWTTITTTGNITHPRGKSTLFPNYFVKTQKAWVLLTIDGSFYNPSFYILQHWRNSFLSQRCLRIQPK